MNRYRTHIIIALLLVAQVWIFWTYLSEPQPLVRDDILLLPPITTLASVSDYVSKVKTGVILDLQPVRDLSYIVDQQLIQYAPFWDFHFFNFLCVWLFALAVFKCLRALQIRYAVALTLALLVVIHPLFVSTYLSISARKHWLAAVTITYATLLAIRAGGVGQSRADACKMWLLYSVSLLCQPIIVAWPLWYWGYCKLERRQHPPPVLLTSLLTTMVIGAATNAYYYYVVFPELVDAKGKVAVSVFGTVGISVLAFARGVFNVLLPLKLIPDYYPGNLLTLAAVPIVIALSLICGAVVGARTVFVWLGYMVLLTAPTLVQRAHIFWSDTYMISASLGLIVLVAKVLEKNFEQLRSRSLAAGAVVVVVIFCLVQDQRLAGAWTDDIALNEYAFLTEATPRSTLRVAQFRLASGDIKGLEAAVDRMRSQWPDYEQIANSLLLHGITKQNFGFEQTREIFSQNQITSKWEDYYLATILADEQKYAAAEAVLGPLIAAPDFQDTRGEVVADVVFFCQQHGGSNCMRYPDTMAFKMDFDERAFKARLMQNRLHFLPL